MNRISNNDFCYLPDLESLWYSNLKETKFKFHIRGCDCFRGREEGCIVVPVSKNGHIVKKNNLVDAVIGDESTMVDEIKEKNLQIEINPARCYLINEKNCFVKFICENKDIMSDFCKASELGTAISNKDDKADFVFPMKASLLTKIVHYDSFEKPEVLEEVHKALKEVGFSDLYGLDVSYKIKSFTSKKSNENDLCFIYAWEEESDHGKILNLELAGGKICIGQTSWDSLVRETKEEIGLKMDAIEFESTDDFISSIPKIGSLITVSSIDETHKFNFMGSLERVQFRDSINCLFTIRINDFNCK